MKSVTLFSTCMVLLLAASFVHGQGFRGGMGAGRSSSTWAPASPSGNQTLQRSQTLPASPAQRPDGLIPQNRTWTPSTPTVKNPGHSGTVSIAPPPAAAWVPRSNWHWQHTPHRPHRPRHFHRHAGAWIVGVPYVVGTTMITQVAPGVVRAERHYVEGSPPEAPAGRGPDTVAPFDPTPQEIVDRMLVLAGVKKSDVIYDLGSGDGRVLIAAAKKYSARGVGFEIDAGLVKLARENARREGVETLVEFRQQDFLSADLSPASLVTLYLSYDGNLAVREQLNRQLKPGARVVSYTFDMGDWPPKIAETYRDAAGDSHSLYLWVVTAPSLASRSSDQMLQPHPTRNGPLIIEVR